MITLKGLAAICGGLYAAPARMPAWAHFNAGEDAEGICWAILRLEGVDVVVFRGSKSFLDWLRNLMAVTLPIATNGGLGPLHPGFYQGMPATWRKIARLVGDRVIVIGHSLGGARACVCTGQMALAGVKPLARVVWGCPRPGFQPLADLIKDVPAWSFRNGDARVHDYVTAVPFRMPPLELYEHAGGFAEVHAQPQGSLFDRLGIFAWHHFALYESVTPDSKII